MDIEKLISCVYNRPTLWDKHSKNYNNRDVSKRLWAEVASEMDMAVADIKKKWSNLRDQFRKEYNKYNEPGRSGAAADHKLPSWTYYESLLFLMKQITPKPLSGNVLEPSSQEIEDDTESTQFSSESLPQTVPQPGPSPLSQPGPSTLSQPGPSTLSQLGASNLSQSVISTPQQHTTPHTKPIRVPITQAHRFTSNQPGGRLMKKRSIDVDQEYLEIEKRKLQLYESRSADKSADDPDRNFLLSLLPYLKEVSRNRKIFVQRKLLDVFMEEENTQTHYSPASRYSEELSRPDSGDLSSNMSFPQYIVNIEEPLPLTINQMTPSQTSTSAGGHLPLTTNQRTPSQTSTPVQSQLYTFTHGDLGSNLQ
ncbi:uncharacterized protein [Maniola hyperantus]|uniref:uncharacterized protein n=1 Tax=Aphantopus hyperantus TaxID=2795564 RepID=UPI0015682B99|nr:uncharacterized protein LOC117995982 [Maniola hyperantus]